MSTDLFEDTLRDLLRDTADAAGPGYLEPDAERVVGLGRRVVRRQRYATGLVAASVMTVAGVVGIAALGPGHDGASAPAGTSSATSSSTGLVTADLGEGPNESPHGTPGSGEPRMVRVTVDRATGHVTYFAGRSGYVVPIGSGQLPSEQPGASWKAFEDEAGVVIGIIPAAAHGHAVTIADPQGVSSSTAVDLVGTDFQAIAIWPGEGSTRLTGLSWSVGTATYGSTAPPASGSQDTPDLVFVDREQGVMGSYSEDSAASRPLAEVPDGELPVLVTGQPGEGSAVNATLVVVLPPGATEVRIEPVPDATLTSLDTFSGTAGGADESLVMARFTAPVDIVGQGLGKVTWTNADGSAGAGSLGG